MGNDDRDVAEVVREAIYVAVGLGVLGFQQAQVWRRQLNKALGAAAEQAGVTARQVQDQLKGKRPPPGSADRPVDAGVGGG